MSQAVIAKSITINRLGPKQYLISKFFDIGHSFLIVDNLIIVDLVNFFKKCIFREKNLQCHSEVKKVKVRSLSRVRLFETPWTVAHQVPPSMGFSRQQYWSGLPLPSPGISSPNPGIKPRSPALQADALTSEPPRKPILK